MSAVIPGQTVSFLQREAAEAARYELELHRAYKLAAEFAKHPIIREELEAMALESRLSSESWMRLANWLYLQRLIGGVQS